MIQGDRPVWFSLKAEDGEQGWTADSLLALRFTRKADADAYINDIGWTRAIATEHIWSTSPAPVVEVGELVKRLREWPKDPKMCEAADAITSLSARLAEATSMLSEQGFEYNRKTNALIERHAAQIETLAARLAECEAENAIHKARIGFDYDQHITDAREEITRQYNRAEAAAAKLAECERERDEARAHIEREKGCLTQAIETARVCIEAATARVAALEKALNRYGKHDGLCGIVGGYGYCTCGFDDAHAALANAEGSDA
jgi:chromosome segregation ATPase